MRILFVHDAFPAQFGHVALELDRRFGWTCHFLVEAASTCPPPTAAMLERLDVQPLPLSDVYRARGPLPWPQTFGHYLESCEAVFEAIRARPDLRPDLVVAHGGRGAPTALIRDLVDCPIINYCEYYFAPGHRDLSYRVDLPPAEPAPFFPRAINAPVLLALADCDAGYSATRWQRDSFPARFRPKIEVLFDGIDSTLYRPGPAPRTVAGRAIPPGTRVVTFVSRGLEAIRGFDLFLDVARRIARERADVVFVVAGADRTYYGWDQLQVSPGSFRDWAMARDAIDPDRILFLGHVEPDALADVLRISDLHLYLTVPFVLSWSLFNALSTGCVVLASDVDPVREVIEPGVNGLVVPLFDVDRMAEAALRVLADPAEFAPLGAAARRTVEERYSIEVAIPPLARFFERVASTRRDG